MAENSQDKNISKEIRKLVMLISDLRNKDNERYTEHVRFMNETMKFIKDISDKMNNNWDKINKTIVKLDTTISDSLDMLLTGINPEGIKETSRSLKEIVETMGKSMQTINLENVMRELRILSGGSISPATQAENESGAESISTQFGSPYQSAQMQESSNDDEPEIYGFVPEHMKKKKKKKKKSPTHLIKPSDLFKS
jgi:hypothetical protein